jgi:hypothetical protein
MKPSFENLAGDQNEALLGPEVLIGGQGPQVVYEIGSPDHAGVVEGK